MRVLIDDCVIIDALQNRYPFADIAKEIVRYVAKRKIRGYITASSVTDIYYIMRKYIHNEKETHDAIDKLLKIFEIIDITNKDLRDALCSKMQDFEDAVISVAAKKYDLDLIITRNLDDFKFSEVVAMSPNDFFEYLKQNPQEVNQFEV